MQDQSVFIADKVFPFVPVQKKSDLYFTYAKEDFLRIQAESRVPGTESAGSGYRVSTGGPYFCDVTAIHKDVDDETRANSDTPLSADRDATLWVSRQLMLKREADWITKFFGASIWNTNLTGVASGPTGSQFTKWSVSGSTPIEDITTQMLTVEANTGFLPNTLVLHPNVYNTLRNHAELVDRIKFTPASTQAERGIVTPQIIANVLDIDRVFVARAISNTAAEGVAGSFGYLAGQGALLAYSAPNPGLMQPSAGYVFGWTGLEGGGAFANRISTFRIQRLKVDRVEGEMSYDIRPISTDLGVWFGSAI